MLRAWRKERLEWQRPIHWESFQLYFGITTSRWRLVGSHAKRPWQTLDRFLHFLGQDLHLPSFYLVENYHYTNRAHLTLSFYFFEVGTTIFQFWYLNLIYGSLNISAEKYNGKFYWKSWPFHGCLYNCIGHWKLTTLTTNRARSMFIQLLLEALQNRLYFGKHDCWTLLVLSLISCFFSTLFFVGQLWHA